MIIHAAFMIENIAQECKDMIYGVGLLLLMMETEGGLWRMNHNDYYAKDSINTNNSLSLHYIYGEAFFIRIYLIIYLKIQIIIHDFNCLFC